MHVGYRVDGSLEFSRIEEDDRFEEGNLETLVDQVGRGSSLHNLILTCCVTLFWLLLRSGRREGLVSVSVVVGIRSEYGMETRRDSER